MFVHVVLDGVADGSLGVGLDVVAAAARVVEAGLVRASLAPRVLEQRVLSIDGAPVRSGAGRPIAVDGALSHARLRADDVLVLPGLSATTEAKIARLMARDDVATVSRALCRAHGRGALVAASCSATFVLGAAGLLAGREATTTWWLAGAFARHFTDARLDAARMVVEDERVLTAGSAFAHADLMLALLARAASPTVAQWVARFLVLDQRPSQSRFVAIEPLRAQDPALRAIERYVIEHIAEPITIEALARAAKTSPRTLARKVHAALAVSPIAFVQRVRMQHAAHWIESTQDSIEQIAARVGYADASAFRKVYRRVLGERPRERRATTTGARRARR